MLITIPLQTFDPAMTTRRSDPAKVVA